jgi:hypothetical protein
MIHSRFSGVAKTLALSVTLALIAGGAAEARDGRGGFSVSQSTPLVRDHRGGPSRGVGGGVAVANHPVIRDHRGLCATGGRRPGGCADSSPRR